MHLRPLHDRLIVQRLDEDSTQHVGTIVIPDSAKEKPPTGYRPGGGAWQVHRGGHPAALENMGAQMVKEVASKTSDIAGDGTTTATVLAQAIYREGARNVTAGASPAAIKRGIEQAVEAITRKLQRMSRPVTGPMIAQVGTISANHDDSIGRVIADAVQKVGKDGVITVEEGAPWRRRSSSSKACNSTAAIYRRTS